jgi:hypothetical protein
MTSYAPLGGNLFEIWLFALQEIKLINLRKKTIEERFSVLSYP